MTVPSADRHQIDLRLQQVRGRGVPQHVRVPALAGQGVDGAGRDASVLVQDVAHAEARQRLAMPIAAQRIGVRCRAPGIVEQGLQRLHGLGLQRAPALLAAFAVQQGLPRWFQLQVAGAQVEDLLHAGTGVVQCQQQRVVAATVRGGPRCLQQGA